MTQAKTLHQQAMEYADLAMLARRKRDEVASVEYFVKAFELERDAASAIVDNNHAKSILIRSAATLAFEADLADEAEKLVCHGLLLEPKAVIAEELRNLYEQINFKRHLALNGIQLNDDEIQMSISGDGVGLGIAPTHAFLGRVTTADTLLIRTAERKAGRAFRAAGTSAKAIRDNVQLYVSAPRPGSFAVTLRVGSSKQADLPGMSQAQEIVDEVLDCLDMYAAGDKEALKDRIEDKAYYDNFVGLAHQLLPDGNEVNQVAFTVERRGETKAVALRSKRIEADEVSIQIQDESAVTTLPKNESFRISGVLKFADSLKEGREIIKLIENGKSHEFVVPVGIMDDIVKPLWKQRVTISGSRINGENFLEEIVQEK